MKVSKKFSIVILKISEIKKENKNIAKFPAKSWKNVISNKGNLKNVKEPLLRWRSQSLILHLL